MKFQRIIEDQENIVKQSQWIKLTNIKPTVLKNIKAGYIFNFPKLKNMIRHYTRSLLFSSKLLMKQFTTTPFNKFITYKPVKNIQSSALFVNNNVFGFAQLPKHHVLNMPALSPTMTQGKIVKWNVKEGDQIDVGDSICEVETDKATVAFESTEKGYIAKITNESGTLGIGKPVAVLTKNKQDVDAFKGFTFGSTQTQQSAPQQSQPQQQSQPASSPQPTASQKSYPAHGTLKLPAVSPTMTEGKIVQWKVKVGDSFDVGDSIFSIETDKATVDYQATEKGVLAKIINQGTGTLPVGEPVAVFTKKKEDVEKFKDFTIGGGSAPQQTQTQAPQTPQTQTQQAQTQQVSQQSSSSVDRVFASPLAKTVAQQKGINISEVKGSGPNGRILKQDVQSFQPKQPAVQAPKEAPTPTKQAPKKPKKVEIPENPFQQIPLNSMRKTIANRLTESKTTIPHYYVQVAVEMGKVLELRQQLNKNEEGVKISVNDIIVKAVALALRDVPDANTQWHGTHVKKFKHSDVSVAVATDGGLITPIVFRAETLGLLDIARKTKDLAKRARQGKLDPSEFIGGTTTVSNLGMFGIDSVTSVINPPQSTILGVGQTNKKVVFDPEAKDKNVPYKVVDSMELIVSADHRVVDGALASKWLSRVKKYLQDPVTMLL